MKQGLSRRKLAGRSRARRLQRTRPFLGKEKLAYDREMATENGTPEAAVEEETSYEKASIACKKGI
jgi:hypothetical protein